MKQFDIIVDPALDCVHLLVTTTCQQWRILVEQRSTGYVWGCGDIGHMTRDVSDTCDTEDTSAVQRTRLQSIKQMSVDRIAILRNRLAEGRRLLKSRSEAEETRRNRDMWPMRACSERDRSGERERKRE